MENSNIISLQNIKVEFVKNQPVLQNFNLNLNKGETLAILGPGGSGKTTIIKVILGIVKPQLGNVSIFRKNINFLNDNQKTTLFKKIGTAFQQGALFDFMTVRENILFALENMTNFNKREQEERVIAYLDQVSLLKSANKSPGELSGGMKRRVGVIRALVTDPELVLLDEPTAGLDPVTTTVIIDMIHSIAKNTGTTIISVTSNLDFAFRFSNKVAILKDGQIIGQGTKEELLSLNNEWISKFLTIRKNNF